MSEALNNLPPDMLRVRGLTLEEAKENKEKCDEQMRMVKMNSDTLELICDILKGIIGRGKWNVKNQQIDTWITKAELESIIKCDYNVK